MDTLELKERYDKAIDILSDGLSRLELLAKNKELREKVDELTELAHDQDDELTLIRAVCIEHGWNPESQIACKSEVD